MSAHVIQLQPLPQTRRTEIHGPLDSTRTWLMLTIAGSVLAGSLLVAALSIGDDVSLGQAGAAAPEPGPAPTLNGGSRGDVWSR